MIGQHIQNTELLECTSTLTGLVEDVRDAALELRMVKIGATFNRFQRVVHDVARELGKDIGLIVDGEDSELDKTVVEKIGDPLMHLVRNAMDHGIEPAEVRVAAQLHRGRDAGRRNRELLLKMLIQIPPQAAARLVERLAAGLVGQQRSVRAEDGRQRRDRLGQRRAGVDVQHRLVVAMQIEHDVGEIVRLAGEQLDHAVDRVLHLGRRRRLGEVAVTLGNPLAGLLFVAHRQLHAGNAMLAPDDAAGADHGLEDCKMLAGHGSLQIFVRLTN